MSCGIYKITNKNNNKCYIGLSKNIEERWERHKTNYKYEPNKILYKAFTKYGLESFEFEIIEKCSEEELGKRETYWIEYYHSYHFGYNRTMGGEGVVINRVFDIEKLYDPYELAHMSIKERYEKNDELFLAFCDYCYERDNNWEEHLCLFQEEDVTGLQDDFDIFNGHGALDN